MAVWGQTSQVWGSPGATSDYDRLRSDIPAWTDNESEELAAALDSLIRLGELRLAREADLRVLRARATVALTVGDPALDLPTDSLVVRQIGLASGALLRRRPESFIREYWPDAAQVGTPRYYAHRDEASVLLAPTPSAALGAEVVYTRLPTGLSAGQNITWLSTYAYDALLAACLVEAGAFLEGVTPERMALYQQRYGEALARLQALEDRNRIDEYLAQGA